MHINRLVKIKLLWNIEKTIMHLIHNKMHFIYAFMYLLFFSNREGRAALVSSFGVFKYLTMYGIVQFIGILLLYWV